MNGCGDSNLQCSSEESIFGSNNFPLTLERTTALKPSFFLTIAIIGILAVFVGFFKTFIIPLNKGSFTAPPAVYLHAAFAFSWILLFLIQTLLIHFRQYRTHMGLGIAGALIALGTAVTMLPAGVYATQRQLSHGVGDTAISEIVGVVTSAIMFLFIVIAAILKRNNGPAHRRLMLLATIVVLWPAWFRFRHYFPSIESPEIWFALVLADIWIVISWIWDKAKNGSVHPVFKYVGSFIILEHIFETMCFDNTTWRVVAKYLYNILT